MRGTFAAPISAGALLLLAQGCGGIAVLDPVDPCAPTEVTTSLGAFGPAKCAVLDQPDLVLVLVSNIQQLPVALDGSSLWAYRFAAPGVYVDVIVEPEQVTTVTTSIEDPCLEEITPFDSVELVADAIPLFDEALQADPVLTLSKASCAGFFDHHGKAVLVAWPPKASMYWFYAFDEAGAAPEPCGPCESLDPEECGCPL